MLSYLELIYCPILIIPRWCTRYDLYVEDLLGPQIASLARSFLTWFHAGAEKVITPSPSMGRELIRMECVSPVSLDSKKMVVKFMLSLSLQTCVVLTKFEYQLF